MERPPRGPPASLDHVPEVVCEACGWIAVTTQPPHQVWLEHEPKCPAVGGAVRQQPPPMPLPRLRSVQACTHRPVKKQIALMPSGVKKYAVMCELCGRLLN